jgi:hypothetical protein
MISESFDRRTLANMEIALERACELLANGSEKYRTRRHIASRIVKCAKKGHRTLGALTAAAIDAAKELRSKRSQGTSKAEADQLKPSGIIPALSKAQHTA